MDDGAAAPAAASRLDDINPKAVEKLRSRRKAALGRADPSNSGVLIGKDFRPFSDPEACKHYVELDYRAGLAFSGGGIRSATIALGLSEALASRGRLYAFDMVSTVSGGGYFGSFLRALHVSRGDPEAEQKLVPDRAALAEATMTSLPDQQYFRGDPGPSNFVAPGRAVKNPLWWLRENGRYLAPGGMSDYGFALVYMVRGWVSLLVFLLAIALIAFAALQVALIALAAHVYGWDGGTLAWLHTSSIHTPLFPILLAAALAGTGVAGAYWLATPLSYARDHESASARNGPYKVAGLVAFLLLVLAGLFAAGPWGWIPADPTAQGWVLTLKFAISAALVSAAITAWRTRGSTQLDFRREQTRLLAGYSAALLVLAVLTAIDWAALSLRSYFDAGGKGLADVFKTGALSGALASALSFLIAKLPDWLGGKESGIGKFLVANARHFALAAALLILLAIALLADVLAIKLAWRGQAWIATNPVEWPVLGAVVGLVGFVALLFAGSRNFANLLALTPFYGSRLTRTFVGGSNVHRLDVNHRSEVTKGLKDDDLPIQAYMEADCAAPLHLINVTRNRTVGEAIGQSRIDVARDDPLVRESALDPRGRLASFESGLTLHDRHGDRMVFGPFGMRVGAEFYGWNDLRNPPSLGLLCAISGAAVGAGMGRLTSLGSAMAFTLANVRLGFWWPEQRRPGDPPPSLTPARALPGLACLMRELLGRFGTRDHWFLSDGGHSENTGVLTLLERGCRFILACDNGQDAGYMFGDLEILIRTARTDIGMEVEVVDSTRFPKSFAPIAECFHNGTPGDWREQARKPGATSFALLLKASDIARRVNGVWKRRRGGEAWIVWIKPARFEGLPADIATYADLNPDFPQQSTGNQFFDEAQWESYRRLGFEMGRRLFKQREVFDPFLPVITPRP